MYVPTLGIYEANKKRCEAKSQVQVFSCLSRLQHGNFQSHIENIHIYQRLPKTSNLLTISQNDWTKYCCQSYILGNSC